MKLHNKLLRYVNLALVRRSKLDTLKNDYYKKLHGPKPKLSNIHIVDYAYDSKFRESFPSSRISKIPTDDFSENGTVYEERIKLIESQELFLKNIPVNAPDNSISPRGVNRWCRR